MVSTGCKVSMKRPRSFSDPSRNDSGSALKDSNRQRRLHLNETSGYDEITLKSRVNRSWYSPRPVIISMLNNKGVISMEQRRYDEARKILNRALRLAEKEDEISSSNSNKDRVGDTSVCASVDMLCGESTINGSSEKKAVYVDSYEHAGQECTSYFTIESLMRCGKNDETIATNVKTKKEKMTTDFAINAKEISAAQHPLDQNHKKSFKNIFHNEILIGSKDSTNKDLTSESPTSPAKSEYDEGMDCFKSPFRLLNGSLLLSETILYNLGRLSHDQGQYIEALCLYERCLSKLEQRSSRNQALVLAVLVGIGQIQYRQGDHKNSLDTYMTALALARSYFGEKSIEVAACLNCVGVLHYMISSGDNNMALDALQTSLQQRIELLGKDHIDVGTTWNNIGRVYFQLKKENEAMKAYCEALRIRRMCQGESVDVAATLFNCGQVYHNLKCRDKALSLFEEFLKLAKIHFGEFHRDICIVTTCIGQVLQENKDYENALKSFQHALQIGNVALGPMHSQMAITFNKMGNLYYEMGDFDSALNAYHRGLEIEIAVLETGNSNTYVTYTNIAEIHKQKGEYVKAMEYYQKVYELQLDHGVESLELANTLSNIGYAKQQLEDFDGALEANQECLRLRRGVFGDTHEDVASTLTHIALVLLKLERHDIALKVFLEAYRIRNTIPVGDMSNLAFIVYNIAHIYHHQGCHDDALKFYLVTAEIEKGLGTAHLDLSITYYNIGQLFYQRGEIELALTKFNEALNIECECYGSNHPNCARTLNEIGNIEMQLGNLEAALKSYTNALRIYKSAGMMNEPVVVHNLKLWRFDIAHPKAAPAA